MKIKKFLMDNKRYHLGPTPQSFHIILRVFDFVLVVLKISHPKKSNDYIPEGLLPIKMVQQN